MKNSEMNRRNFIGTVTAMGTIGVFSNETLWNKSPKTPLSIIKPPRLKSDATFGIIAPASSLFELGTIQEAREVIESLGFRVKLGTHIRRRHGYLAGTDVERAADIHEMFLDDEVNAIIAIRGGYGSGRVLDRLDYDLIQQHPKILIGYSDITSLHLAIHKMTGLVMFHGPVALSTFNEYSTRYFLKTLMETEAIGEIADPPLEPLRKTNGVLTIKSGTASGRLVGGNLTLIDVTLGTPFEIDTRNRILFIEEVGEEPYDIDRKLTHLHYAGKFDQAAGIIIDRCARCGPRDYKPAFSNTFSVEEVFFDRLQNISCPAMFGLSLGHVANKPVLPLGIQASMDTRTGRISLDEAAVQ